MSTDYCAHCDDVVDADEDGNCFDCGEPTLEVEDEAHPRSEDDDEEDIDEHDIDDQDSDDVMRDGYDAIECLICHHQYTPTEQQFGCPVCMAIPDPDEGTYNSQQFCMACGDVVAVEPGATECPQCGAQYETEDSQ